ncbi:hypothetical protein Glove_326g34 [Diversispora epigaea]|uniref:Uncharacterized protein n=1 Tax=Diversispora epigaea TaxID=1348612 RepID=A0A397HRW4_9GLOM|nr:hypothetical protein Glove_326g34 [Diversispora epigaea]
MAAETQFSDFSKSLEQNADINDDGKINFSTISSLSTFNPSSSPFNTISTTTSSSNKTLTDEPSLISKDLIDSVFSTFSDSSTHKIDLSLDVNRKSLVNNNNNDKVANNENDKKNKRVSKVILSKNIIKQEEKPKKQDFRTPTSSFLLSDELFSSIELEKLANEANVGIPISFSSVSLNLDIGDFAKPPLTSTSSQEKYNDQLRDVKIVNNESRQSRISWKERSDCGCTIM